MTTGRPEAGEARAQSHSPVDLLSGLIAMTDMQSDDFLGNYALNYHHYGIHQNFDQFSAIAFLDSHAVARPIPVHPANSDDIAHIYAELHKWVDQAVAKISVHTPPQVDQIREQNRKLIEKLTTLESKISGDTTVVISGAETRTSAATSTSDISRISSGAKTRRISQETRLNPRDASVSSVSLPESIMPQTQNDQLERPPSGDPKVNSKLTKKLLQIGNQTSRMQVVDYAAHLKTSDSQNALPNIHQLSNASRIANASHFMRLVANLGSEIESSIFCEQNSRIRRRIALAHFYHAYTLAQDNAEIFLSWCDDQQMQSSSILPKGGSKSVVQHRFADLVFSQLEIHNGAPLARSSESGDETKRRIAKVQMWRKSGKKWAQVIQRFGYGILLLLPACLSDEDLRVAPDNVIASGLNLIDSRKHIFADVLCQANELLEAHIFPRETNLGNLHDSHSFEMEDWEQFINTPIL